MGVGTMLSCRSLVGSSIHFVDTVIDMDMGEAVVGGTRNGESVIMIQNVTKIDAHNDHLKLLEQLTLGCAQRKHRGLQGLSPPMLGQCLQLEATSQNPVQKEGA